MVYDYFILNNVLPYFKMYFLCFFIDRHLKEDRKLFGAWDQNKMQAAIELASPSYAPWLNAPGAHCLLLQ